MTVRVSVVVPTYKRPHLLKRCLSALAEQQFPAEEYEVLVVDAANDPSTRALVEAYQTSSPTTVPGFTYMTLNGPNHGPAAARNVGWKSARGAIIAFTDDDCIPELTWLTNGMSVFSDGIKGASGQVTVPLGKFPSDYERNAAGLSNAYFVTANCFFRRNELEAVNGFDERFKMAWREDTDLFFSMLERNGGDEKFVPINHARVTHPVRPASWGVSLQQQKKSMYNALLYKKHPQLYRQLIQARPPYHYYATLFALLGSLAGVLLGRKRLSLLFASVWLLLVGRFTAQRLQGTSHSASHVMEMATTSACIPVLSIFWRIIGAIRYRTFFL